MKTRYALLAFASACFAMSNLCAAAQALDNRAGSPELAADRSAPISIERSIKVPWLNVPKEAIPEMSESSAVRMACGAGDISMYSMVRVKPRKAPAPAAVSASKTNVSASVSTGASNRNAVRNPVRTVQPVQTVRPAIAPAGGLIH